MLDVLQDAQWLESLPTILGFDFEHFSRRQSNVDAPLRPYFEKTSIRFVEKDGIYQYPIAVAVPTSDERLAYIVWNDTERRYAYEEARYIQNPPAVLTAAIKAGKVVTFFDTDFDPAKEITLGEPLPPRLWQQLRDAAEGKPGQIPQSTPV